MNRFLTVCGALAAFALGGNAALAATPSECHSQAMAYANQHANPVAGAVVGGVIGALGGGVLGEVFGQGKKAVGAGALVGGGVGATVGAVKQKTKHEQLYNEEYYRCMNTPVPTAVYYEIPPAGSPEWNYYCSIKYKSFRASDGTFQPFRPYEGAPLPPRQICVLP